MTYYWASEPDIGNGSGALGACDNKLVAGKSVAVPASKWNELKGRRVSIEGVCDDCVVDDMCEDEAGGKCREIDLYVGKTQNGHDGIKNIKYTIGEKVAGHKCR